jgi:uncharacterized membrane protein YccC
VSQVFRGFFDLRPAPPHRWFFSLRAALGVGAPVLAGWWLNDVPAGLMATLGGFTAIYGSGRPYLYRAAELALIALAFSLCVGLGLWVSNSGWATIATVAAIAMLATWVCNALHVGPPGAYLFTLACAAATAMPAAHLGPGLSALLVLGGGAFAWSLHMVGALFAPRGPERHAVIAAGESVSAFLEAIGTPRESAMRHRAASSLHQAWSVLVNQQLLEPGSDSRLARLRALNRELHLCFADGVGSAFRKAQPSPEQLEASREITLRAREASLTSAHTIDTVPLGRPRAIDALRDALNPDSNTFRVIVRVGIAAVAAGAIGGVIHLERAYWAVAATVLMLHQGFDWLRTIQRSIQRLVGTWIGLLLAGAIIVLHPQGLWLALTIMALQFTIEMLVIRNYGLAVIFITGAALTIASGAQPIESPQDYLLARGIDTLVGCIIALIAFRAVPPRAFTRRIPAQLEHTLNCVANVITHLATGEVTTHAARTARRDLQSASFALAQAHEDGIAGSRDDRRRAENAWPTIAATENLAYRTLSICWALERLGGEAAKQSAASMFGADGEVAVRSAIDNLKTAIRADRAPNAPANIPSALRGEIETLTEALGGKPA